MGNEWLLNAVTRRWGLNKKTRVGAISDMIHSAAPGSLEAWINIYRREIETKGDADRFQRLGRMMYDDLAIVRAEIDATTEQDCIKFLETLVFERSYDGYRREIYAAADMIASLAAEGLNVEFELADADWQGRYDIDYFISCTHGTVGIQVKPASAFGGGSMSHIVADQQNRSHARFTEAYGGRVFFLIFEESNGELGLLNDDVIGEIYDEVVRLS